MTAATLTAPRTGPVRAPGRQLRPDVQALRAVAVAAVVVFHVWPAALPGGYVGVDVFFVVSGFLITSHLVSRPPRTLRDLVAFWARRVRRLLPASLLVLVVTLAASRLVAPETRWAQTAQEAVAAAFYVENWQLARTAVDYLDAENPATPVQHFWSLSVEEQFYLVWPLLVAALVGLALVLRVRRTAVLLAGLGVVALVSFAHSVSVVAREPAAAYFVTPARAWEFAAGGLLAVVVAERALPLPDRWRRRLAWAGYATLAVAAVRYTGTTPFPGWAALLPVAGTVAVVAAAAQDGAAGPGRYLHGRGVQAVGDWSYSVYLWHWPLVVLAPAVLAYEPGRTLGVVDGLGVVLVSLVLAAVTKRHVEDRFRSAPPGAPLHRPFAAAALGMVVVAVLGQLQVAEVRDRTQEARAHAVDVRAGRVPCAGAAAMAAADGECERPTTAPVVPMPAEAADDLPEAYAQGCFSNAPFPRLVRCTFGDPEGDVDVAVIGNSHVGHWLPALDEVADERGWRLTTFMASECTFSTTPVEWETPERRAGCLRWAEQSVAATVEGGFDLVVASARNGRAAEGLPVERSFDAWVDGYREPVARWSAAGVPVLVVHDTATPIATTGPVPDCVASFPDDLDRCSGPRDAWVPRDPLVQAARESGDDRIRTADLNDLLCDRTTCPPVVGGVLVYRDSSHLTATFARTLTPHLEPHLVAALAGRG